MWVSIKSWKGSVALKWNLFEIWNVVFDFLSVWVIFEKNFFTLTEVRILNSISFDSKSAS